MSPIPRIAIIGGGISGLAVACELQRLQPHSPSNFVLFESTSRLGGIVETVTRDGFVIECGPDAWVTEKPWARKLATDLGLESKIIPSNDASRRTLILQEGKLLPMPDGMRMMVPTDPEAIARSPLFTAGARQAYANEPARAEELKAAAPQPTPDGDESVGTFVRRHFGEEVAENIAGPLLSGIFGGNIERLSVRSVMPAFVAMERERGSLILALQHRAAQNGGKKTNQAIFTTLASGLGTLVDAITATLPQASLRLNQAVSSISKPGREWVVLTDAGTDRFDAVVLATPAHVTRQLLAPLDGRGAGPFDELLNIDASSAIVVALAFREPEAATLNIPQGFGFLVPQQPVTAPTSDPSLLACTFVDQKFPNRVPEAGKLLRAFYGGQAAPALLKETDESLTTKALNQLRAILGPLPDPAFRVVRRWPRSLPQYEVGHQTRVAQIEQRVATIPGLHLVGNTYHGVGLPDLIRDSQTTARRVLGREN